MEVESLVKEGTEWFPAAATDFSGKVDFVYYVIYYSSIAIFVVLLAVFFYFCIRYRKNKNNQVAEKQVEHNYKLEVTWTIIPLILVMILFAWGFIDFIKSYVVPSDAIEYRVVGQKWNWIYTYPEIGATSSELVVPVGENVKLSFVSRDVLHSFFIPNFRIKRDVLPNTYTTLWFNVDAPGKYRVFCTEFCGDGHSTMLSSISAVTREEYEEHLKTLEAANNLPPAELGAQLYKSYGCNACHSIDGSNLIGPTWLGLWGKEREFTDGTRAIADENYLRTSIIAPGQEIVVGYNNVMPSFAYLTETQIIGLIEYIKTLEN